MDPSLRISVLRLACGEVKQRPQLYEFFRRGLLVLESNEEATMTGFSFKFMIVPCLAAAFLVVTAAAPRQTKAGKGASVSFNRDVRPILSEHCYRCHGPSAKEGQGGLRLDDQSSATKDRHGYVAIKPGDSAGSRLIERVSASDDGAAMPPPDSGVARLTADQVEVLRRWIDQGAKYERHWALIPPKMPTMPAVKDSAWARNPIDLFILQRLEAKGLRPEPEADRTTLLRRASLALTGLQPTPEEVDRFLKDKSKDAYEKAVDRLLASKRYGEHEARYWLDAVRYGDTHGLHLDNERAIYPYRDWVVRAFNQDLPFDRFALWQLAGDMLPSPTPDQLVATGYVRMNPTTNEGGAIAEEFQAKNTFDRVDTTSTVFLGMTVACARCHNHKYDPISQQDYYRLFAFFNSTADEPLDGNLFTPDPVAKAPTPAEAKELDAMERGLQSMESKVNEKAARDWLAARRVKPPAVGDWEVSETFPAGDFDKAFDTETPATTWAPIKLEAEKDSNFLTKENAYAYLRTTLSSEKDQDIGLRFGSDDGIKVWLNDKLIHSNKVLRALGQSIDVIRVHLSAGSNRLIVKVVNATGPGGVRFGLGDDLDKRVEDVSAVLLKPEGPKLLKSLYLEIGPETPASRDYRVKSKAHAEFLAKIPSTLIARELPKPRPAFVLRRGEYNLPTVEVKREIPAALGALPKAAPANRLGFAEWLTSQENPLFTRVFVNRVWQQHFGTGIVKTSEDFGNQGEWPSHPELLDYLAVQFAKGGYSIKKLHRLIVTSAAFRQRAFVDKAKLAADPDNRLISRGPRFRLDAEVLRDQALYASGLLVEKPGGHGFKPYQPAGLWEEVAFQESTTAKYVQDMTPDIYRRSLYLFWKRTSPHPMMLTFDAPMRDSCIVRRARTNTPLQALTTMNEPGFLEASRHFAERIMKAVPTINEQPRTGIKLAFELALGRQPAPAELSALETSYQRYRTRYGGEPAEAAELVNVGLTPPDPGLDKGQLAAWMLICSTLFNTDEFLTQH
ncbi:MAG: PSD1 domain-containing protein [Armatimonadetes bacterium]|nr:PSD1 domain-containing protein [Armatimonadota bacterium]